MARYRSQRVEIEISANLSISRRVDLESAAYRAWPRLQQRLRHGAAVREDLLREGIGKVHAVLVEHMVVLRLPRGLEAGEDGLELILAHGDRPEVERHLRHVAAALVNLTLDATPTPTVYRDKSDDNSSTATQTRLRPIAKHLLHNGHGAALDVVGVEIFGAVAADPDVRD